MYKIKKIAVIRRLPRMLSAWRMFSTYSISRLIYLFQVEKQEEMSRLWEGPCSRRKSGKLYSLNFNEKYMTTYVLIHREKAVWSVSLLKLKVLNSLNAVNCSCSRLYDLALPRFCIYFFTGRKAVSSLCSPLSLSWIFLFVSFPANVLLLLFKYKVIFKIYDTIIILFTFEWETVLYLQVYINNLLQIQYY